MKRGRLCLGYEAEGTGENTLGGEHWPDTRHRGQGDKERGAAGQVRGAAGHDCRAACRGRRREQHREERRAPWQSDPQGGSGHSEEAQRWLCLFFFFFFFSRNLLDFFPNICIYQGKRRFFVQAYILHLVLWHTRVKLVLRSLSHSLEFSNLRRFVRPPANFSELNSSNFACLGSAITKIGSNCHEFRFWILNSPSRLNL